jgi:transposase InsO family protein
MSTQIQEQTGWNARQLGLRLGVPRSTLNRWRGRARRHESVLQKPGPKKLGPLNLAEVALEIEGLRHRLKRSGGTGALYQRHQAGLSRRDLAVKVQEERTKQKKKKRASLRRVEWKQPNLAWAIDATEYEADKEGNKLWVHPVKDLASRHQFEPLTALESRGNSVAAHLEKLFRKEGAPLFLKRDNGSAFNNQEVDDVLARWGVIPLNSPAHYPRYNGSIEKAIRELKVCLSGILNVPQHWDVAQVGAFVSVAAEQQNYKARRCLGGLSAKEVYRKKKENGRWSQRQRHNVLAWTRARAKVIMLEKMKTDRRSADAAWRLAVETWLGDQALIEVHKPAMCYPI